MLNYAMTYKWSIIIIKKKTLKSTHLLQLLLHWTLGYVSWFAPLDEL